MSFGFVIPTCCRKDIHFKQLLRCLDSIKKFHPNNHIILIDDSDENYNLKNNFKDNELILVQRSYKKGSADQQVFKIILDNDYFDKAIILQDSMILNKKLENIEEINNIQFIWHCTNHRIHWDIIKEPTTEENIGNNIITHTDLIHHCISCDYGDNKDFQKFAIKCLNNKNNWCVIFGNCCIITKKIIKFIDNKTNFVNKFIDYTSNRQRRVNDSIFSLICHFCYPDINFSKSYDGLYYDGSKTNKYNGIDTGFDNLTWCCKNNYISKVSFNR